MSITNILIILLVGYALFELVEHVIFPLVWYFINRKKKPLCGIESMVGKEVKVEKWQKNGGWVNIYGELWKASSDAPLLPGDKAIIEKVEGLVLIVKKNE